MTLDVGVHDGFEVLEFAVLEEVDDVDLGSQQKSSFEHRSKRRVSGVTVWSLRPKVLTNLKNSTQASGMNVFLLFFFWL